MPDFDKLAVENEVEKGRNIFDDDEECTCPKLIVLPETESDRKIQIEAYVKNCPAHGWD